MHNDLLAAPTHQPIPSRLHRVAALGTHSGHTDVGARGCRCMMCVQWHDSCGDWCFTRKCYQDQGPGPRAVQRCARGCVRRRRTAEGGQGGRVVVRATGGGERAAATSVPEVRSKAARVGRRHGRLCQEERERAASEPTVAKRERQLPIAATPSWRRVVQQRVYTTVTRDMYVWMCA